MKTTEEKIAVMAAYKEGKKIERQVIGEQYWMVWNIREEPHWNWELCDYRIKEEPKYRPYKTIEEVLEAIKNHGHYVKDNNTYRILKKFTLLEDGDICYHFSGWTSTAVRTWDYIHDKITWADGAPFGVMEE